MPTTKWPDLRSTDPTNPSDHLAALKADFNTLRTFSESDRSSTGRDRKIPSDLFKKLHDSFTAFSQKSAGALSRQLGPQMKAGTHVSNEDALQDFDEATVAYSLDGSESLSACYARSRKKTKLAHIDDPPPSGHCTFIVSLNKHIAARIKAMDNAQKRNLICRATKRDPNEIACHSGKPWIIAVRLKSKHTLEVYCHDKYERSLLLAANISTKILDSAMDSQKVTFGVLMENVQADRLNLQPEVKNYMAAQMLAAVNVSALPSLVDHRDLLSVQSRQAGKKGLVNLMIEFATPKQANEAILEGLIWDEKRHKCKRLLRDSEIQKCSNCQRFGHVLSKCTNGTACELCLRPHPTDDCLQQPCKFCGKQHSLGSLCKVYGIEKCKVKELVRLQQPLWPLTQDPGSGIPLGLESHRSHVKTSSAPAFIPQSFLRDSLRTGDQEQPHHNSDYGSVTGDLEPSVSPIAIPAQVTGTSTISITDTQHLGQGLEAKRYEAVLRELDNLRGAVYDQAPNSPTCLRSPASAPVVTPQKKRKAITALHVDTTAQPDSSGKRVKYGHSTTPPRVMDQVLDPVEEYIRENGCVTVEAGESLKNALERAGIVTEPLHRAERRHRRRRSPVAESSWYKWTTRLPNSRETCQQPLGLDYRSIASMTEQRGRALPDSHQLPYSYGHHEDLSGERISAYE